MSSGDFTATMKVWKAKNPEKLKAQKARWYARHKDEINRKNSERIAANPEPKRIRMRAWKVKTGRQNDARLHVSDGKLSKDIAARLFALQRGKCACCALPLGNDYQRDHIMPLALGGLNIDSNIQLLRRACNLRKHAKHPIDYMQSRGKLL